MTGPWWI